MYKKFNRPRRSQSRERYIKSVHNIEEKERPKEKAKCIPFIEPQVEGKNVKKEDDPRTPVCYQCGNKGHMMATCFFNGPMYAGRLQFALEQGIKFPRPGSRAHNYLQSFGFYRINNSKNKKNEQSFQPVCPGGFQEDIRKHPPRGDIRSFQPRSNYSQSPNPRFGRPQIPQKSDCQMDKKQSIIMKKPNPANPKPKQIVNFHIPQYPQAMISSPYPDIQSLMIHPHMMNSIPMNPGMYIPARRKKTTRFQPSP